jgi:hypothetical protein
VKLFKLLPLLIFMVPFHVSARDTATCYVFGYAYKYDTKTYYFSNITSYKRFHSPGCAASDTHAEINWNDFFGSEIDKSYKYTKGASQRCECLDNQPKSEVISKLRKQKKKYRRKGFDVYKLKGFSVSDR